MPSRRSPAPQTVTPDNITDRAVDITDAAADTTQDNTAGAATAGAATDAASGPATAEAPLSAPAPAFLFDGFSSAAMERVTAALSEKRLAADEAAKDGRRGAVVVRVETGVNAPGGGSKRGGARAVIGGSVDGESAGGVVIVDASEEAQTRD